MKVSEAEYQEILRRPGVRGAVDAKAAPAPPLPKPARLYRSKAEEAWAARLEARRLAGEIRSWRFEAVTLKLGFDCRYTPDFYVVLESGAVELHEVKGGKAWDDAMVKLKAAATQFPQFTFVFARLIKTTWIVAEVAAA